MPFLPPLARAAGVLEIIDGPQPVPFADMARCMMDIVRMNGLFGGRRVTMIHVKRLLAALPADHLITVLDVGTGAGDIPREVVRWARREGRRIRVFALDRDAATLQIAGQVVRDYPEITFVRGDALSLPIRPGSIDLAISAMTLHHLEPAAGTRFFSEMDTAARMGFVVNDLVRSRIAHAVVWLITRFITRSAISRHDGPLSVRRSYTPREVSGLCEKAGVADVNVVHHWPYLRLCAVRDQRGRGGGRWRKRASVSPATILDEEAGRETPVPDCPDGARSCHVRLRRVRVGAVATDRYLRRTGRARLIADRGRRDLHDIGRVHNRDRWT